MCGIAGYYGREQIPVERIEACEREMRRRGPDGHGRYQQERAGNHVVLLHSRLSILDLDARANQPFLEGGKALILNGELYNYLEVKKQLEKEDNEAFRTTSDTEVLLRALRKKGLAALDQCEGMWAFAVYDEKDGTLLLCRDRFGEKPLYLFRDDAGIYFGSEVKFLQALSGKKFQPNREHLLRYLVNGYKSLYKKQENFYVGVSEVPAAAWMKLSPNSPPEVRQYWNPSVKQTPMSFADSVQLVRERLIRAVELRLRADVPLAFCMSGGIDSNALISIAKRRFHYDVHGFTIASSDARYDERDLVDKAKAELGIRHSYVATDTRDFLPNLRALVRQHDAPVYTITYYAHWLLMRAVSAGGYKISISGTAADELFTGYYDHHLSYLYEIRNNKKLHAESLKNWQREVQPVVRNPFLQDPDAFCKNPGLRDHIFPEASLYGSWLKKPWREEFTERNFTPDLLRNRMLNELFAEVIPVILHEDDLNAMYFSIENRSPFLDRELFQAANSIPTENLIRDGKAKAVLREAMRGIVPDCILDSPKKVGFNASIHEFLDHRDPKIRGELLAESPIFELLERAPVAEMLGKDHLTNEQSKFLFNFLNAKIFLEEF